MNQVTAKRESTFIDRRNNARLRSIFPDARIRMSQLFRGSLNLRDNPLEFLAERWVHETYPELSAADIRLLVCAINRDKANRVRHYSP